ncbi:MAG: ABC transporter ATP-binding protein [Treponema sp.]|nr:ABC transporter ATP-binding protein [Treponema sp.]
MILLDVKNLTIGIKKGKETYKAVDNISFSIKEGEILGLAGESGCGKTTTALAITNLLPQGFKILNGEINFGGQSLTRINEKELCRVRGSEIGMIFQEVRQSLNPLMKTGKQITEALVLKENKKENEVKQLALDLLFSLGFDEPQKIFETYPHQLSRGMCQRVMTAIAAICRPKLLLADEPSSALDEESLQRVLALLLEMNCNYKTSLLIISHDLSIIRQFCSRYLVMYAGKIIEESSVTPNSIINSPFHPYTRALINALPEKNKRGKPLDSISGKVPSIEDRFSGCPFAPRCPKAQNICNKAFPPETKIRDGKVFCHFPETGEQNGG